MVDGFSRDSDGGVVSELRSHMREKAADMCVIAGSSHEADVFSVSFHSSFFFLSSFSFLFAALDEIMWLLNVRGSDIPFNPVVISYLIVTHDRIYWFIDQEKVSHISFHHYSNLRFCV